MSDDCVYLLIFQNLSGTMSAIPFSNAESCLECYQYLKDTYQDKVFVNLCSKIEVNSHMDKEIKHKIKDRIEE